MEVLVRDGNNVVGFRGHASLPILYSALRCGIDLPHECISGTCGSCKAKLVAGEVERLWADAPGWLLIKPDERLLCQCIPVANCEFEVKGSIAGGALQMPPELRPGRLRNIRQLAPDVRAFSVEFDQSIEFIAGQFVAFRISGVEGARCYSMVNSDSPTRQLDFVIKRKPGGSVSKHLFETVRDGEAVECFGPVGKAVFDPTLPNHLVCIAGGSGIAGMMSIMKRAGSAGHFAHHDGHVFFGVRTSADAFFLDEFSALTLEHPRVSVTVALSDAAPSDELRAAYPSLRFESGLVHDVAARSLAGPLKETSAFVAGPPPAVTAALKILLLQLKIPAARVKYDKFA